MTAKEKLQQFDLFISYCHKQEDLVKKTKAKLVEAGFTVWIDTERPARPEQSMYQWMAEGIIQALIVLSFFSKDYEDSENCQCELIFAKTKKKPILYIRAEEGFRPQEWLCMIMKAAVYLDLTGKKYEEQWKQLMGRINQDLAPLKQPKRTNFYKFLYIN